MEVAVAGRRRRWRDAKGAQRVGRLFDELVALGHDVLKLIHRLHHVVGGEDGDDGLRIPLRNDGSAETDGIERIAAGRFTEKLVGGQLERLANQVGMLLAGTDVSVLRWDQSREPVGGQLQQALAVDEWN